MIAVGLQLRAILPVPAQTYAFLAALQEHWEGALPERLSKRWLDERAE